MMKVVVDVAVDPGFEMNDHEHYVQDCSLDEEEFVKIAQTGQNHLNVEVYQPPEPHDENPDDVNAATNEADIPTWPISQQFTWQQRKPSSAEIDATFTEQVFLLL